MPIEHNPQDIADLIAASVEAMQMKHNYTTVESGRVIMPEINESLCCQPSELELRIRKEVLENIEALMDELYENGLYNREYHIELLTKVRDRLNLLWGERND